MCLALMSRRSRPKASPIVYSVLSRHSRPATWSGPEQEAGSADNSVAGYPVYLNGELRNSGWWYYYLCSLALQGSRGNLAARRALDRRLALANADARVMVRRDLPGHGSPGRALRHELSDQHQPRTSLCTVDFPLCIDRRRARLCHGWKGSRAREERPRGRSSRSALS